MNTKIITFSILAVLFMTIAGAASEIAPCFVLIIASALACIFAAAVLIVLLCEEIKSVCDKKLQVKVDLVGQIEGLRRTKSELETEVNNLNESKTNLQLELEALEGKNLVKEINNLKAKNAELIAQLEGLMQIGKRLAAVEEKLKDE